MIYILDSYFVDENFHSRYIIKKRISLFIKYKKNIVHLKRIIFSIWTTIRFRIDERSIKFIGEHDFASFCSYDQYGNTIRELYGVVDY